LYKKRIATGVVSSFFCIILFTGCAKVPELRDGDTIVTNKEQKGVPAKFSFMRGSSFGTIVSFGPAKIRIMPQISIWVEDSSHTFRHNIYVTRCFAKQQWRGINEHPDSTYRTSSFPYWLGRLSAVSQQYPTSSNPLPDAVSSATPQGSFTIETTLDSSISAGTIWCEFNSSFDTNEIWQAKGAEKYNGQPSLIYACEFNLADAKSIILSYKGHGGATGTDHGLYNDENGIVSAKQIFSSISVEINPGSMSSRYAGLP
jgi:hypothetical protein